MKSTHPTTVEMSKLTWLSLHHLSPFDELETLFRLTEIDHILNAQALNLLKNKLGIELPKQFVCQSEMQDSNAYYEEKIFTDAVIPTRPDSWHDLFNGLIWLQFPKTKGLLNRWHLEDIQKYGLNPRTHRRNQTTHFDECGVILVTDDQRLLSDLREHQFKSILFDRRQDWHTQIQAIVFGHANYEMLMRPYIGLTGKWLSVPACDDYIELPRQSQLAYVDEALYQQLSQSNGFCDNNKLFPLPLLGVPNWCQQNNQPEFYDNTDYFRPKPAKKR
jgi:hypothetical protein